MLLETLPGHTPVTTSVVPFSSPRRLATETEALAVIDALTALGVLAEESPPKLDREKLAATEPYRRGVWDAIAAAATPPEAPTLCATLPYALAPNIATAASPKVADLRGCIFDLLASARWRAVIASPFWDEETSDELAELIVKRASVGVKIDILGRVEGASARDFRSLVDRLNSVGSVRLYSWYDTVAMGHDSYEISTFHFKAVVVDAGRRAYLGSANMTRSGLRSRMELGVILAGEAAVTLAGILDAVLAAARLVSPRP